jgi:hypothetical protein
MKRIIFILPVLLLLISCEVEGYLTRDVELTSPIPENTPPLATGNFMPTSGIKVTGSAKIYLNGNQSEVRLEDFSVSSGPDLKVYLSKNDTPTDFVNLGNLTSATVYTIPTQVNVTEYKYVLIHCQQYNHLFAVAQLSQN